MGNKDWEVHADWVADSHDPTSGTFDLIEQSLWQAMKIARSLKRRHPHAWVVVQRRV